MITLRKFVWLVLLLFTATAAQAGEPRAFVSGTLQKIITAHHGKPFILGLWSLSCSHCREELTMLGQLMAENPDTPLVLLSTDSIEQSAEVAATLQGHGLAHVESWVFADPYTERLHYELDSRWYGELPRTYLYERDGTRKGYSGRLEMTFLHAWLRQQEVAQR